MSALSRYIINHIAPLPGEFTMANGPERYAPTSPNRIASLTLESVAHLGKTTADEVRKTASDLEAGAHDIAEKLRELAAAMEQHSEEANKHVSAFCDRAMEVFQGTRDLQARLNGETKTPKQQAQEDYQEAQGAAVPGFLTQEGGQ